MVSKSGSNKKQQQTGSQADIDFAFLQNGFVLFHRNEANRQLLVQISDNKQVEKPSFLISKCDTVPSTFDVNQLPCEIIGLDCKKAKKPVKVRFHPEVLKMAKRSETMIRLIHDATLKLIEQFLLQEWTMEKPEVDELPKLELDSLRQQMLEEHIHMSFNEESTDFHWKIANSPRFLAPMSQPLTKKSKKVPNFATLPTVKFQLNVHPVQQSKLASHDSNATLTELDQENFDYIDDCVNDECNNDVQHRQRVGLEMIVGRSTVHTMFNLDFNSYYPLCNNTENAKQENEHFARFVPELGILHIRLCHAGQRPIICYGQSSVSISGCDKMLDCAQLRIESLRHNVRQNHHQDNLPPAHNQLRSAAPIPVFNDCGPIASAFHNPTRVALFQLTNNTQRPIQMSRFVVTPVTEAPSAKKSNRQLHVRVHSEENEKQSKVEVCSGSPSESTDSGMPNSPAFLTTDDDDDTLSPLPSAQQPLITSPSAAKNRFNFGATAHSQPNVHPQFRERSASECLDMRQPVPISSSCPLSSINGSSSSLSPNGTPLRSILKKPKILPPGLGNSCVLATSNMRRVPARYLLARSISECHDESATILSSEDLQFVDDDVISMEDLSVVGTGGSPLSTCAEVDEETGDSSDSLDDSQKPTGYHKKRVSFNEQVQARIYRSSSSIIATKNKQDRKLRNRMRRRAESESSDQPFNPEDLIRIPTIPLCKLSAEEKAADEDAPNCEGQNKVLPPIDRRDSGFDSNDSGMDSPPEESHKIDEDDEEMQVETSAKRVQRVISSDSAFGDEIMME